MQVAGALCLRHDRPQQRSRARHLPDLARHRSGIRSGWPNKPTSPTEIWNASVPDWNTQPDRAADRRGRRSPHGAAIPEIAPYLPLSGQVRTVIDPRSTLYNTDGQIFSDAGVPVRAVHGELRHQPPRLPRHPRHDGEHRPRLRRGRVCNHHRIRSACRDREASLKHRYLHKSIDRMAALRTLYREAVISHSPGLARLCELPWVGASVFSTPNGLYRSRYNPFAVVASFT